MVAPRRMPAVEWARVYLQNRPTQSVTLQEVGAIAGVTISHLVRSFSRTVGLPPKSYHAQVRLARARRLLAEGKSATWVAYECGFADQSHLSRRFRECHGITPGAFQAQYRAELNSLAAVESSAACEVSKAGLANETGGLLDGQNVVYRFFKPLLAKAELPTIRLYDLRHTHATLLMAAGQHPKVVQERLGHASIQLTLDTYSHVVPGMQERASEQLDTLLATPASAAGA